MLEYTFPAHSTYVLTPRGAQCCVVSNHGETPRPYLSLFYIFEVSKSFFRCDEKPLCFKNRYLLGCAVPAGDYRRKDGKHVGICRG